jgi:hypothetical protein
MTFTKFGKAIAWIVVCFGVLNFVVTAVTAWIVYPNVPSNLILPELRQSLLVLLLGFSLGILVEISLSLAPKKVDEAT